MNSLVFRLSTLRRRLISTSAFMFGAAQLVLAAPQSDDAPQPQVACSCGGSWITAFSYAPPGGGLSLGFNSAKVTVQARGYDASVDGQVTAAQSGISMAASTTTSAAVLYASYVAPEEMPCIGTVSGTLRVTASSTVTIQNGPSAGMAEVTLDIDGSINCNGNPVAAVSLLPPVKCSASVNSGPNQIMTIRDSDTGSNITFHLPHTSSSSSRSGGGGVVDLPPVRCNSLYIRFTSSASGLVFAERSALPGSPVPTVTLDAKGNVRAENFVLGDTKGQCGG